MSGEHILKLRAITKDYPGVRAVDQVDFDLRRGEVHAVVGENGAGKSTLMNILGGVLAPDSGDIFLEDRPVRFLDAADAVIAVVQPADEKFRGSTEDLGMALEKVKKVLGLRQ